MSTTRRRFLCCLAGAAGGLAYNVIQRSTERREVIAQQSVSQSGRALGTTVTITAIHQEPAIAARAIKAAFRELDLVESVMSLYRPRSQLRRLNEKKFLRHPHPYLVQVLEHARGLSIKSGGAYDATIQPLWLLFAAAKAAGSIPSREEIDAARRRVDWRMIECNSGYVRLLHEDTLVTLNGIAQGFATDRARAALQAHNVQQAIIDAGEIGTLGTARDGDCWRIGIQHPRHADAYISLAELAGRCLATSGDYATTFSDDLRHHHIFDPRTGQSPTDLASVSVVAQSGLAADGLSTALFVLGVEQGAALVHRTPGASALFVRKDGSILITPGFPLCSSHSAQ